LRDLGFSSDVCELAKKITGKENESEVAVDFLRLIAYGRLKPPKDMVSLGHSIVFYQTPGVWYEDKAIRDAWDKVDKTPIEKRPKELNQFVLGFYYLYKLQNFDMHKAFKNCADGMKCRAKKSKRKKELRKNLYQVPSLSTVMRLRQIQKEEILLEARQLSLRHQAFGNELLIQIIESVVSGNQNKELIRRVFADRSKIDNCCDPDFYISPDKSEIDRYCGLVVAFFKIAIKELVLKEKDDKQFQCNFLCVWRYLKKEVRKALIESLKKDGIEIKILERTVEQIDWPLRKGSFKRTKDLDHDLIIKDVKNNETVIVTAARKGTAPCKCYIDYADYVDCGWFSSLPVSEKFPPLELPPSDVCPSADRLQVALPYEKSLYEAFSSDEGQLDEPDEDDFIKEVEILSYEGQVEFLTFINSIPFLV